MLSLRTVCLVLFVCLAELVPGGECLIPLHSSSSSRGFRRLQQTKPRTYATKTAEAKEFSWDKLRQALSTSKAAPIRIKWIYRLDQAWLTPAQKAAIQNTYIPETTAFFQHYLNVRVPAQRPIKFTSAAYCRSDLAQDKTLSGAGYPNTDIVLHVRGGNPKDPNAQNGCDASTFAYAKGCDYDPITLRPTVGQVTICPNLFSQTEGETKATMHHEVLHALGFSSEWFVFFYNQDGGQPYSRVAEERPAGSKEKGYMTTPRLTAYARSFFGCPSLPGAPFDLAEGGGGAHWPTALVPRDLMVGGPIESGQGSKMTMFTLLLLEDSGWYVTNQAAAEELEVGRGLGCSFATGQCDKFLKEVPKNNNFCPASWNDATVCTPDFRGIGWCEYGASGCLIPSYRKSATEILQCTKPYTFQTAEDKAYLATIQKLGGVLGPTSRCVVADADSGDKAVPCSKDGKTCTPSTRRALCVETKCNAQGQVVLAFKGQKEVVCQRRGGTIDLAKELPGLFSTGTVYCPLPETVCPTLSCGASGCGPNADCWRGSCKCHMGFAGSSCKPLWAKPAVATESG